MSFRILTALVVTIVLWSSAFPAIRCALREGYDAMSLTVLRFVVAMLAVGLYALARRMRLPEKRDLPAIFLSALFGIAIYHILLNYGERTVDSGTAAFLIGASPMFTALIARVYLNERLNVWGWAGIGVSMTGILLTAIGKSKGAGLTLDSNALLIVGSALSSAIYIVYHKPYLSRYSASEFMTYMIFASVVLLAPFLPHAIGQMHTASTQGAWMIVYLGIFPAAIAYITWTYLVANYPVSRAAALLYAVPPMAMFCGWIFLHETPGLIAISGGLLAMTGVVIVNRLGNVNSGKVQAPQTRTEIAAVQKAPHFVAEVLPEPEATRSNYGAESGS